MRLRILCVGLLFWLLAWPVQSEFTTQNTEAVGAKTVPVTSAEFATQKAAALNGDIKAQYL